MIANVLVNDKGGLKFDTPVSNYVDRDYSGSFTPCRSMTV